jgi:hypothetical protein
MLCNNKQQTSLAAVMIAGTLLAGTPAVFAHTGISSLPVAPKDGQGSYLTAVTITHGCAGSETQPQKPVVGASIVFPNSANSVATKINADNTTEPVTDLSQYVQDAVGGGLPTLAPALIQDDSVFKLNREVNEGTTVRGFRWLDGAMKPNLYAYLPFRVTIPTIVPTTCVSKLRIRTAAADYCTKSQSADNDARADIWFGVPTALFNDSGVQPAGYYPTLTVERELPGFCGGVGFEIAVQPSNEDVDKYLPIKGFWPTP